MELNQYLHLVNIPDSEDKIYKDESVYCFDTPESENGLFVCLKTFYGVSKEFLPLHYEITKSKLYLHMRRIRIEKKESDEIEAKPSKITKLAIGVEGGFNPDVKNYTFEEHFSLILYPEFKEFNLSEETIPEKIKLSVTGILSVSSAFDKQEILSEANTWDGEKRIVTKYADLEQLDNGVKISPKNWKCMNCNLTDNLWLNLTDGSILCGRKNFDGSGGNNHAAEHYEKTKYPLAVKLGTISPQGADVYSYPEDNMVENPNLAKHLSHFNININTMEKTEKSMIELEIDANKKVGEWLTIQESNSNLVKLFGPGYVGFENLGNSCYLNSVMQVLFSLPEFKNAYYPIPKDFKNYFDPVNDFNFQMHKLAYGLYSSFYSSHLENSLNDPNGIKPTSFKYLLGKNHAEFSTKRQQDAQEFFLYIMDLLEKNNSKRALFIQIENPGNIFKFKVEDKTQCTASSKVNYVTRDDYVLSLPIPLETASNLEELAKYEEEKLTAINEKNKMPDIVRPKITLMNCLKEFSKEEIIDDFLSPVTKTKTQAKKTFRLKTFPDYLMLHMKKFTLDDSWQPVKIDCSIEIPEILDLSFLRGKGLQPGEEKFENKKKLNIEFNQLILSQLMEMGYSENACKRALYQTKSNDLYANLNWLFENQSDPNIEMVFEDVLDDSSNEDNFIADPEAVDTLLKLGLPKDHVLKGLKQKNNNVALSIDWIFSNQEELNKSPPVEVSNPSGSRGKIKDGNEKYRLIAFISHMGPSTQSGHYVCHIFKDEKWVIYNDNKVAISENPPIDLAYMYLFKRID